MEIRFFDQIIENFIAELEKPTLAKTLRILDLLEEFGNNLGMPHSKKKIKFSCEIITYTL